MSQFNIEKVRILWNPSCHRVVLTRFRTLRSSSRKKYAPECYQDRLESDFLLKFDSRKGATWHCIVGRNFGSFVTHGEYRMRDVTQPTSI